MTSYQAPQNGDSCEFESAMPHRYSNFVFLNIKEKSKKWWQDIIF